MINWGPGIRIYIHQDGDHLVLLMGGSYSKNAQSKEIAQAQAMVVEYKKRKKAAAKAVAKTALKEGE